MPKIVDHIPTSYSYFASCKHCSFKLFDNKNPIYNSNIDKLINNHILETGHEITFTSHEVFNCKNVYLKD